jgi:hypothetical protein
MPTGLLDGIYNTADASKATLVLDARKILYMLPEALTIGNLHLLMKKTRHPEILVGIDRFDFWG